MNLPINKNKIIFAVIWVLALIALIYLVSLMNGATKKSKVPQKTTSSNFSIWIVEDEKEKFTEILKKFKDKNKAYTNINFVVENFSDYEEYFYTLQSAIIAGKEPDVFMLNNNEKSGLEEQVSGLDPAIVNAQNFRKEFKTFFGEDLIRTTSIKNPDDPEKEEIVEFLAWIPLGYETLWIFYNRRYIESKDVASWASISDATKQLKETNSDIIPLALWNGSTVPYSYDILTQFFMLDDIVSFEKAEGNKMKQWLTTYLLYGDVEWNNAYNTRFADLISSWKNAIDLFSKEEVAMLIGYPRMLNDIDKKWFKKTFLMASPFPHYFIGNGKSLVNYNYFVINKNTKNYNLANDFLAYLISEEGQNAYLDAYPYYLPAMVKLEEKRLEKKVNTNFNIALKDFMDKEFIFSSFDKGLKAMYDKEITNILDDETNATNSFERLKNVLLCKYNKMVKFEKLSTVCK